MVVQLWGTIDLPQVTSYDYDALLDEVGNLTAKYFCSERNDGDLSHPEYPQSEPFYKESMEVENIPIGRESFFRNLDSLSSPIGKSLHPKKMEELRDKVTATHSIVMEASWDADEERIWIIDGR